MNTHAKELDSAAYLMLFYQDTGKLEGREDAPECPIICKETYPDPKQRKCDCPCLREIAAKILEPAMMCSSNRPCPVRAHLLAN